MKVIKMTRFNNKFLTSLSFVIFCFTWSGLINAQGLPAMSSSAGIRISDQAYGLLQIAQECSRNTWPNQFSTCVKIINEWNSYVVSQQGVSQPQLPPISSPSGVMMTPGTQQMLQEAQSCQQNPLNYSFNFCNQVIKNWNSIVVLANRANQYQACGSYITRFNTQGPGSTLNPPPGQTYQSCAQMLYSN
jgi:hypothetical protein